MNAAPVDDAEALRRELDASWAETLPALTAWASCRTPDLQTWLVTCIRRGLAIEARMRAAGVPVPGDPLPRHSGVVARMVTGAWERVSGMWRES